MLYVLFRYKSMGLYICCFRYSLRLACRPVSLPDVNDMLLILKMTTFAVLETRVLVGGQSTMTAHRMSFIKILTILFCAGCQEKTNYGVLADVATS